MSRHGSTAGLLEVVADDLAAYLDRQVLFEDLVADLDAWLEPIEFATGETIVATGEKSPWSTAARHRACRPVRCRREPSRRVRSGRGDRGYVNVGERKTPGEVRATEPCRTLLLTPAAAAWLERNEEALALRFYRYVVANPAL